MTRRAVVTFDDEHFTVYGDDKLLISVPAAVVRKKSASPVAIAFGKEALDIRDNLPEGQMFSRPFRDGTIVDTSSAKLIIRNYFRILFGLNHSVEIYILISSGIASVARAKIEQTFIACGYKNIYIVERPYLLAKIAESTGFNFIVHFGTHTIEAAQCEGGKTIQAHAVNIGFNDIGDEITSELCAKHNLSACLKPSTANPVSERTIVLNMQNEVPILNCCSLSLYDYTPVSVIGQDLISGDKKTVVFSAKELFPYAVKPYQKAVDLLTAMLMGCDEKTVVSLAKKGILYIGEPTKISMFYEYMSEKLHLPVFTDSNPFMQVKSLYSYLNDDGFLNVCLGFQK